MISRSIQTFMSTFSDHDTYAEIDLKISWFLTRMSRYSVFIIQVKTFK
ncbi:hypothetical protein Pan110_58670 [Gimesia panareensis]|nr:hypothetical protein Pan110_58670 [Gimesia panareensis]